MRSFVYSIRKISTSQWFADAYWKCTIQGNGNSVRFFVKFRETPRLWRSQRSVERRLVRVKSDIGVADGYPIDFDFPDFEIVEFELREPRVVR